MDGDQKALEALRVGYCRVHSVRIVHLPPNLVPPIIRLDVPQSSGLSFVEIASDGEVDFDEAAVKVHCQRAQNAILRYGLSAGNAREALSKTSESMRGHFDKLSDRA